MRVALTVVSNASPERETLAAAIAQAAPSRDAADKARRAAETARGALALALGAVPAAERAVEVARAHAVENPDASRAELRAARQALVDAGDDLAIASDVVAGAEATLTTAERAAKYAEEAVSTAVDNVLLTQADALEADVDRCMIAFARACYRARRLANLCQPWDPARLDFRNSHAGHNVRFVRDMSDPHGIAVRESAAMDAAFERARAALLTDPAAPLPEAVR